MVTRLDVRAGRVPDRYENGVLIPPSAQINEFCLRDHVEHLRLTKYSPLTTEEINRLYPDEAPPVQARWPEMEDIGQPREDTWPIATPPSPT